MEKKIVLLVVFTILMSTLVYAADVGYILKGSRANQDILNVFSEMNLSFELIKDKDVLKTNLNNYKLIFIGDERLSKTKNIPVYNYPSVIMNKYYGKEWGLTDDDGISQLASTAPLRVRLVSNGIVKVYSEAKYNGANIPYYFLDDENKANFISIARTYTGNNYDFGDVIATAQAGTHLINGKISGGKMCFYGIAKTKYWTPEARNLFKECVGSVLITCERNEDCDDNNGYTQDVCVNPSSFDSYCENRPIRCFNKNDCGADRFAGLPYCLLGNVFQDYLSFSCINPGNVSSSCANNTNAVLKQACLYGCSNGICLAEQNPPNINLISPENNANTTQNVSFVYNVSDESEIRNCSLFIDSGAVMIDNSIINGINEFSRTLSLGSHNWSVRCVDEFGNTGNSDTRIINVKGVACYINSNCGNNGLTGSAFCGTDDLLKNYRTFTCNNPGSFDSYCSYNDTLSLLQDCGDDSCGSWNINYCKDDDVYKNKTCHDRGCALNSCFNNSFVEEQLVENCSFGCNNGSCNSTPLIHDLEISLDYDTSHTINGIRIRNGSTYFTGNPAILNCSQYSSYEFKSRIDNEGDFNESYTFICNITHNSLNADSWIRSNNILFENIKYELKNVNFLGFDDGNYNIKCEVKINGFGDTNPFNNIRERNFTLINCEEEPECVVNSDCGNTSLINNYCVGNNVTSNYSIPACLGGSCQLNYVQIFNQTCSLGCLGGSCIGAMCGNGILEPGEQCDDSNLINGDGCSSACQITTQCNDGVDNDRDGFIDYPNDPGCINSADNDEVDPPECIVDADCTADYYSSNYCLNNSLVRDFHNFSCVQQSCNETNSTEIIQTGAMLVRNYTSLRLQNGLADITINNNGYLIFKGPVHDDLRLTLLKQEGGSQIIYCHDMFGDCPDVCNGDDDLCIYNRTGSLLYLNKNIRTGDIPRTKVDVVKAGDILKFKIEADPLWNVGLEIWKQVCA